MKYDNLIKYLVSAGMYAEAEKVLSTRLPRYVSYRGKKLLAVTSLVDQMYRKYPKLRKYKPRFVEKSGSGSGGKPEARQSGDEVWIFPKFWRLPTKTQIHVLVHEVGHYALSKIGSANMMKVALTYGVDVWELDQLAYDMHNFDESFAEAFAAYFTDPSHLKRQHPQWYKIIEHYV